MRHNASELTCGRREEPVPLEPPEPLPRHEVDRSRDL
jgi:hypothetical protein